MPTARWRSVQLLTGVLALDALVGTSGCQDVFAVERIPEKVDTTNEVDASAPPVDEPDLSGTLFTFDEDAGNLLSVDPSTGQSTVLTAFANAGDYITAWSLVADPEAHQLVVYRHDVDDPGSSAISLIDAQTGEILGETVTQDFWQGIGRVEATGQLVGVSPVDMGAVEWWQGVANIDLSTGHPTLLAARPPDPDVSHVNFDGVGTFFGYSLNPAPGHVTACALLDAATAESGEHLLQGDLEGVVYDPSTRNLLATTLPPHVKLVAADLGTGSEKALASLSEDIDFTLEAVLDRASHRYFTVAHDSTTGAFEVTTVDVWTGKVARRPLEGPAPAGYSLVFLPPEYR